MSKVRDLSGQVFGRLTAIERAKPYGRRANWRCRCECGRETVVVSQSLLQGKTRSCGCLKLEVDAAGRPTHGLSRTPEYVVWCQMVKRCHNPAERSYPRYGGRGIAVCERWRASFVAFIEDMGTRPSPKHHIDRVDNERGYEPGNCRWSTPSENGRNKRNNHILGAFGESKTLADWAEDPRCRVTYHTLKRRLSVFGWDAEKAIITPPVDPCPRKVEAFGEAKSLADWSKDPRCRATYHRLRQRVGRFGWDAEKAITTPNRPMPARK